MHVARMLWSASGVRAGTKGFGSSRYRCPITRSFKGTRVKALPGTRVNKLYRRKVGVRRVPVRTNKYASKSEVATAIAPATTLVVVGGPAPRPPLYSGSCPCSLNSKRSLPGRRTAVAEQLAEAW
jgi:hypothetical protein